MSGHYIVEVRPVLVLEYTKVDRKQFIQAVIRINVLHILLQSKERLINKPRYIDKIIFYTINISVH